MQNETLQKEIEKHIHAHTLLFAVLSLSPLKDAEVLKIVIRPLKTQQDFFYQVTKHYEKKVTHHNYKATELLAAIWPLIGIDYRNAVFFTSEADVHVLVSKKHKWTILNKKPTRQKTEETHNRLKNHIFRENESIPFLVELGVMRVDGSLIPKMAHKFRQINRFIEMIADILPHLPKDKVLNIVDFGCGKSYLTFAIYHYLCRQQKRSVRMIGLDLKADVVAHCESLARQYNYDGLHFQVGDINTHKANGTIDMVVSLHACDTATDAALEKAIDWEAKVILCVPCCQHEVYNQIKNEALMPLLKHGILRERFAALATDAARAQLLEAVGYRTQVMEFIDMEHTPKNLLIRAIRSAEKNDRTTVLQAYRTYAQALSIHPSLEMRLKI